MTRERALKVLLVLVGLALTWCVYPLVTCLAHWRTCDISIGDQMILGIYFPIGIFLVLAVRDLPANRTLILCFAWSTIAHDAVMVTQAIQRNSRGDLLPLSVIAVVCVALLLLAPKKVTAGEREVGRTANVE
jgi:hypothetical protein